jgi:hypothetical protein
MEAWARELELVRCGKQAPVQRISYVFCYIELSPVFSLFALNIIQKKKQRVSPFAPIQFLIMLIGYRYGTSGTWISSQLDTFMIGRGLSM